MAGELQKRITRLQQEQGNRWTGDINMYLHQLVINGTLKQQLARNGSSTIIRDDNGADQDVIDSGFLKQESSPLKAGARTRYIRIGANYELISFLCDRTQEECMPGPCEPSFHNMTLEEMGQQHPVVTVSGFSSIPDYEVEGELGCGCAAFDPSNGQLYPGSGAEICNGSHILEPFAGGIVTQPGHKYEGCRFGHYRLIIEDPLEGTTLPDSTTTGHCHSVAIIGFQYFVVSTSGAGFGCPRCPQEDGCSCNEGSTDPECYAYVDYIPLTNAFDNTGNMQVVSTTVDGIGFTQCGSARCFRCKLDGKGTTGSITSVQYPS